MASYDYNRSTKQETSLKKRTFHKRKSTGNLYGLIKRHWWLDCAQWNCLTWKPLRHFIICADLFDGCYFVCCLIFGRLGQDNIPYSLTAVSCKIHRKRWYQIHLVCFNSSCTRSFLALVKTQCIRTPKDSDSGTYDLVSLTVPFFTQIVYC